MVDLAEGGSATNGDTLSSYYVPSLYTFPISTMLQSDFSFLISFMFPSVYYVSPYLLCFQVISVIPHLLCFVMISIFIHILCLPVISGSLYLLCVKYLQYFPVSTMFPSACSGSEMITFLQIPGIQEAGQCSFDT